MSAMIVKSPLGFHRLDAEVPFPHIGSQNAACFDLHAHFKKGDTITRYLPNNEKVDLVVDDDYISIKPGERVLVPTGIIFDIPIGFSVRLHARSGLALKRGLVLANSEGVIDSDYVDPTFVMVANISDVPIVVKKHERICQAELVLALTFALQEIPEAPTQKSDRDGGFGSTGTEKVPEETGEKPE
jgi:dUTP pyrophosphatase